MRRLTFRILWPWSLLLALVTWHGLVVVAQESPPALCESQVRDAYNALITDQILQPEPGGLTWGQQLMAVTKKLRMLQTQYGLRRQEADMQAVQADQRIAQLAEQNRELQQRLSQMLQAQSAAQAQPPPPEKQP